MKDDPLYLFNSDCHGVLTIPTSEELKASTGLSLLSTLPLQLPPALLPWSDSRAAKVVRVSVTKIGLGMGEICTRLPYREPRRHLLVEKWLASKSCHNSHFAMVSKTWHQSDDAWSSI